MLAALEAGQEAATIESVLRPYNDLLVALFDPAQEGSLLSNVHPDEAMRDAAAACEPSVLFAAAVVIRTPSEAPLVIAIVYQPPNHVFIFAELKFCK